MPAMDGSRAGGSAQQRSHLLLLNEESGELGVPSSLLDIVILDHDIVRKFGCLRGLMHLPLQEHLLLGFGRGLLRCLELSLARDEPLEVANHFALRRVKSGIR